MESVQLIVLVICSVSQISTWIDRTWSKKHASFWVWTLKYVDLGLHLGEKLVLHLTRKVLCPLCWLILSWYKSPVLDSKSAVILNCSQVWGRFESGVLLEVDTIASLSSFLLLLLFQCLNWSMRSVRIWKSGNRICILSMPYRMVRKHLTYHQVGVSLPSFHKGIKATFSVLQFKAVNSKNITIFLKS